MIIDNPVISNEEYRKIDAISSSDLDYLSTNPYLFSLGIKPQKKSKAMDFGTLVHTLTLEPSQSPENGSSIFAIEPQLNKRTKAGKEAYLKWCEENKDKIIIKQEDLEKAKEIANRAKKLIEPFTGFAEHSFVANWSKDIKVKCRPDFLTEDGLLIDLKTISNIDLNSDYLLSKAIRERKYHRQLAFYKMVLELKGIEVKEAVLIFCNTEDLWVRGVRLNDYDLQRGKNEAEQILDRYSSILKNGLDLEELFKPIELPQY